MIKKFEGKYRFLSNFGAGAISYEEKVYPTAEHLYQALKTLDEEERESVRLAPTPGRAKKIGQQITKQPNWDEIKEHVMLAVVRGKFQQNRLLASRLRDTGNEELQEGNWWGDVFWGVSLETGVGKNKLGKILEKVREEMFERNIEEWG